MQQGTNFATKDPQSGLNGGSLRYHLLGRMHNDDSVISYGFLTLTSAQILALFTTPIVLLPAPGVGKILVVRRITCKNNFNSVAYTGANALEARYTDAAGAKVTGDIPATFINAAANAYYHAVPAAVVPVENSPIVLAVPTANPGAGNGTIAVEIEYAIRKMNG